MTRICDGYANHHPCPRRNPCEGDCHFNTADLEASIVARYEFPLSDRLMCIGAWAFITVIVFTLALPVVWLIGVLV